MDGKGSDASIEFIGRAASHLCNEWVQKQPVATNLWLRVGAGQVFKPYAAAAAACTINYRKVVTAFVQDSGGQTTGQLACQSLLQSGWRQGRGLIGD